ncbi:MAG TPA: hypothetical protein PLD20_00975 [Blastocatellia bacterium]|nr:hypothetical protein [Blastocatellia bacterium]HMV81820.1 hypothetical protein [Blastocatellia bacterium]HMX23999.1 hypothetical protein [Blastocatellia bacterium]HMY70429.1 hypothetical protein [Blastocatellia bacterium]HMZ16508.1 hypothetical protein [Blastocatellia bacterium]
MADLKIKIDTTAIEQFGKELDAAGRAVIDNLIEPAAEYTREEAPVRTGRLQSDHTSVSSETRQTSTGYEGDLIISAFSKPIGSRQAQLVYPSGKTKTVSLRPQPEFNYAEAVARGRKEVRPVRAKLLLIPVASAPANETYVRSAGEIFILRRRAKATKPNPFPERALKRLEQAAPGIIENTLANFGLLG